MKMILFLLICFTGRVLSADFQAGVARIDITPPMPFWLSGYAARTAPATTVRNPLWAKALALSDDRGGKCVIVTADLIGIPADLSEAVTRRVHEKYGLRDAQLLMNFSHTHYGPVVRPNLAVMFDFDPVEMERTAKYRNKLADNFVSVVGAALEDLSAARISWGQGTAGFAGNRRQKSEQGVRIGENPDGPTDHSVPVIRIAAPDGRLRAVLFAYSCHGTTMAGSYNEVDSDFAGFAQRAIEKDHAGATALYMILCAADQNPKPRGEYAHVEQHGRELSEAVERILAGDLKPVKPGILTALQFIQLDFAPHTRQTFEAEAHDTSSAAKWKKRRAAMMLEGYEKGKPIRHLPYAVQAIRLGDSLTFLALGGEVVVDYALRAKREFPKENLIVAGYSHDVSCYIPSLRILREGGYEAVDSMIYYGQPGPLAESVEETIFKAVHRVIDKTRARSDR